MIRSLLPALACAALPGAAAAQACLGNPSFASGPINVSVSSAIDGNGYGFGASSNVGWWEGKLITGIGAGHNSFRNPTERRNDVSALIGTQRRTEDNLEFCPIASARYETGSEFERVNGGRAKVTLTAYSVGIGFGAQLAAERYVSIIPFGIVRYSRSSGTFEGVDGTPDEDLTGQGGVFTFGLGFRFDEWLQLSPTVSVSSYAGSDLVIGLRGSMALQLRR